MRPGTLRYHRSLGFVGEERPLEKIIGFNFERDPDSKTGVSVGMAPSTLFMGVMGSVAYVALKPSAGKFTGSAMGFVLGTMLAGAMKYAASSGV